MFVFPARLAAGSLLTLFAGVSSAGAQAVLQGEGPLAGARVRIDDRMAVRYYIEDERLEGFEDRAVFNYGEEVNRFNLLVSKSRFAMGAQVDQAALFANYYILDGEKYRERDLLSPQMPSFSEDVFVNVEKLFLRHQGSTVEMQVGDGYVSFGRGIALNLVRNTDIDVDTSLRGLRGVVRLGSWDLTAVTGLTNHQQVVQDYPVQGIEPDDPDMITGVRAERFGIGPINAGVHGVAYRFSREEGAYQEPTEALHRYEEPLDAVVGGITVEGFGIGGVDFVVEGDAFDYRSGDLFPSGEAEPGYGLYGSASSYPGRFVVLIEGKRYRNTERINAYVSGDDYEVAVAPTLEYERVITEDSSAAVNSDDILGTRLAVNYIAIPGKLLPRLSMAAFRDYDTGSLHFNQVPETILHPVAGVEWNGEHTHVLANAGVRQDIRDDDTGQDVLLHGDVDFQFPLASLGVLEFTSAFKRFAWARNEPQQSDFTEMENALAFHRGERWTFILYQDYSDNPLIDTTGNLTDEVYGAAEVQFKPDSSTTLKAFYGAYKAGIRCAGGQCRKLPGFEGVRVSLQGTF